MLNFAEINEGIAPPDADAAQRAAARWDAVAKPLHGLGALEDMVVQLAALTGSAEVSVKKRAVLVFCADNGVVAEGVTQTDAAVTAIMARAIAERRSCVCRMAAVAGAETRAVDMGMLRRVPGVEGCHIADGTRNIAEGPAMSREEACRAVAYGMELAADYKKRGCDILATGEMGIGNTTTSSAIAAALLGLPARSVTGRGAGLSDEGLARKCIVIKRALAVNRPDRQDALDVLAKLGGFDIAGMTGLFIGGALYRIPVVIDGLISAVAALLAATLCPNSRCAMLASHSSAEPAAERILRQLELRAILRAGLRLGEGTGAVCLFPLLDMALSVYQSGAAFADAGIAPYRKLGGEGV